MKQTFQDLKTKINLTQTHALIGVSVLAGIAVLVAIIYYRRYQKAIKSEKEANELQARTQKMYEKMLTNTDKVEDMLSNALVSVKKSQDLLKKSLENNKEGKEDSEKAKTETSAKSTDQVEPEVAVADEISEAEKEQIRTELRASINKKPQDKIGDVVSHAIESGNITELALSVISKVTEIEPDNESDVGVQEE